MTVFDSTIIVPNHATPWDARVDILLTKLHVKNALTMSHSFNSYMSGTMKHLYHMNVGMVVTLPNRSDARRTKI